MCKGSGHNNFAMKRKQEVEVDFACSLKRTAAFRVGFGGTFTPAVPNFVIKLCVLLERDDNYSRIRWSDDGMTIIIDDVRVVWAARVRSCTLPAVCVAL